VGGGGSPMGIVGARLMLREPVLAEGAQVGHARPTRPKQRDDERDEEHAADHQQPGIHGLRAWPIWTSRAS
jgi:hypothetical protein